MHKTHLGAFCIRSLSLSACVCRQTLFLPVTLVLYKIVKCSYLMCTCMHTLSEYIDIDHLMTLAQVGQHHVS